ncbi:hypothetical protein O3G_MSEX007455 [Manduca sexta]|uniref:Lysosomal protein NCU-G1 n=2 Tax=Manduca sexta TaxID=7130 RepID=A0A921Z7P1_MANSE|nr:hypothetical protein O3G_MSEX007455 [Manduca sexta]
MARGQDRKIVTQLNPGCVGCGTDKTLMYIRAEGPKDTMHLVWDFIYGPPLITLVIGETNSSLVVNWNGTSISDFFFNGTIKYSFFTSLYKLYEYNDTEDVGYMTPQSPYHYDSLEHLTWTRADAVLNDKEVMVRVDGHFRHKPGTVEVKLRYLPFTDYASDLPHLIHTANSTLVDVSLVNLTSSRRFNSSRFALNMVLLPTDIQQADELHFITRKSLDDEHTPGVFEIIEIKTPQSFAGEEGGYLQFRPVAYTDPKREVSSSTNVHMSPFNNTGSNAARVLRPLAVNKDIFGAQTFVSFGMPGDGFYTKHNYTAWSFTAGYGTPPVEGFSLFVIIIISIGLGVPVLLALSGIIYVIDKRYKQRNMPQRLTDNE